MTDSGSTHLKLRDLDELELQSYQNMVWTFHTTLYQRSMPRRKKGRDKPRGKKRNRQKDRGFLLNTRPYNGPKDKIFVPREHTVWEQRRPVQTGRTLEDIIGFSVLHGDENPVSKLMGEGINIRKKRDDEISI